MKTWSSEARRVIALILAGLPPTATDREKRAALRAAYPFGPRKYHPYKQWCKEVRLALARPLDDPDAEAPLFDYCGRLEV
jgi:hypothetical protein